MAKPKQIRSVTGGRVRTVKLLVYGEPGYGKTMLAGTSPKALLLRPPQDHTDSITEGDAEEWVVHDWNEMREDVLSYARHEGGTFDWIWLDSISIWQDVGLDDIWATVVAEKPARARYGPDKGEYGINMHRLGGWVRDMVEASEAQGFNFGITAHPRELRPTEDEEVDDKLMPYIQGKNMSPKICGYMNVVALLEVSKKGNRVLRFNATDRYYAKDQFKAFEDGVLWHPTIPKVMDAINAARPKPEPQRARRKATRRRRATK